MLFEQKWFRQKDKIFYKFDVEVSLSSLCCTVVAVIAAHRLELIIYLKLLYFYINETFAIMHPRQKQVFCFFVYCGR